MTDDLTAESIEHQKGIWSTVSKMKHPGTRTCILIILIIGLAARLILAPISSSVNDFAGWVGSLEDIYNHTTLYDSGRYFYTPVYGYVLGFMSIIFDALNITSFGTVVPDLYGGWKITTIWNSFVTNYAFNFIFKIPLILFDILCAALAYEIVKRYTGDKRKGTIAFAIMFLTPVAVTAGSVYGMFECLMIFFMFLGLIFFAKRNYLLAGASLSVSVFTKLFSVTMLPVMIAYMISDCRADKKEKMTNVVCFIIGFLLAFLILYLPVIMAGDFEKSFKFLTDRLEDVGMASADTATFTNVFYYAIPLTVFFGIICFFMIRQKNDREDCLIKLLIISLVAVFSLPLVNGTPTYGAIVAATLVLFYMIYGKITIIPWILLLLHSAYGIVYYGESLFTTLLVSEHIMAPSLIHAPGSYGAYELLSYLTPLCGISVIIIILAYTLKRRFSHEA